MLFAKIHITIFSIVLSYCATLIYIRKMMNLWLKLVQIALLFPSLILVLLQSVWNVLGQIEQKPLIATNVNPIAPCPMLRAIFRHIWCVLVFKLRKQHWLGREKGEGSSIVCNKLNRSSYNLKLHVSQQLWK
jgi:hypothetical protein